MCMRSRKLKRLENVSQLKKGVFALHSNCSCELVILFNVSKKLSKLVSFRSTYNAHCTVRRRQGWEDLLNVLSLLRLGI